MGGLKLCGMEIFDNTIIVDILYVNFHFKLKKTFSRSPTFHLNTDDIRDEREKFYEHSL
jgi:hypothetical protein